MHVNFNFFRKDDFLVRACVDSDAIDFKDYTDVCGIELEDEDLDQIELKNGCACSTDLCNGEQQKIETTPTSTLTTTPTTSTATPSTTTTPTTNPTLSTTLSTTTHTTPTVALTTQKTEEVQPPAIQQELVKSAENNFSTLGARIYNELLAFGILILFPLLK